MSRVLVFITALGVFALPVASARAGWVIRDRSGASIKIQSGRMKVEVPGAGAMIIDTTDASVTVVAAPLKSYSRASINAACRTVRQTVEVYEDAPDFTMSPTEESKLRLGQDTRFRPRGVKVERRGRGPEISGVPTRKVMLTNNGDPMFELLVTNHRPMNLDISDLNLNWILKLEKCGLGWSALAEERLGSTDPVQQSKAYQRLLRQGWIVRKTSAVTKEVFTDVATLTETRVSFNEFKPPKSYKSIPFKKMVKVLVDVD